MNIAIIGTGNIGGTLAKAWAKAGHRVILGVRNTSEYKGSALSEITTIAVAGIAEAVAQAEVILLATPAQVVPAVAQSLGDTSSKIIIDATNAVFAKPEGYAHGYDALKALTQSNDIVKCFNTTGYENMANPVYNGEAIDMFMAGDSERAKNAARQLALDAGFGSCYDFGAADKVALLEQFALCWINLAIMQKQGRDIAFKVVRR